MGQAPMGPGMMGFGNAGPAASAIPGATEVRVVALNFSFTPSEIRVPHATDVNLTLSNPAANGVVHDLTVPALGIHIVANPGETKTVGLRGLPAGRYDTILPPTAVADMLIHAYWSAGARDSRHQPVATRDAWRTTVVVPAR